MMMEAEYDDSDFEVSDSNKDEPNKETDAQTTEDVPARAHDDVPKTDDVTGDGDAVQNGEDVPVRAHAKHAVDDTENGDVNASGDQITEIEEPMKMEEPDTQEDNPEVIGGTGNDDTRVILEDTEIETLEAAITKPVELSDEVNEVDEVTYGHVNNIEDVNIVEVDKACMEEREVVFEREEVVLLASEPVVETEAMETIEKEEVAEAIATLDKEEVAEATVTDVIDPETTLANQESEKEAMRGLIDSNVVLGKESDDMKTQVVQMEEKCHDLESKVTELNTKSVDQEQKIHTLEDELSNAKVDEESKKALDASNQKVDDLERQLQRMTRDDHEKTQRIRQLELELETSRNQSPVKSKMCTIL